MSDATAQLFERLAQRGHEPLLKKANGTVRFEVVEGRRSETWLLTVDHGDLSVSQTDVAADCALRADKALFDGMARGEVNAMAAVLRGELELEGDPTFLALLQRLLPSPPRARRRRKSAAAGRRRA